MLSRGPGTPHDEVMHFMGQSAQPSSSEALGSESSVIGCHRQPCVLEDIPVMCLHFACCRKLVEMTSCDTIRATLLSMEVCDGHGNGS